MGFLLRLWRTRRVSVLIGAGVLAVVITAVVVALVAGGGSGKHPARRTGAPHKAKPKAERVLVAPLTGLPDPSGESLHRPAVTVKINNTSAAKQWGIDKADVVYEEVVEGGITRLAAIFNSQAPDKVGPVRSVRRTDQSIVWPIGGIFAYSGGAQYAIDSINTAPVKQLDETRAGPLMYRDPVGFQYEPFNLWAHVDKMYGVGATPTPPPPLFAYRKTGAKVGGTPTSSFVVGFAGGYATTWTWDAGSGTWLRTKFGAADVDGDGVRLAAQNVVVMAVPYIGGAGVEGAEAGLTGTGNLLVFTKGKELVGHWTRPDKAKPAKLVNLSGGEIKLTPGRTWVELPDVTYAVNVVP